MKTCIIYCRKVEEICYSYNFCVSENTIEKCFEYLLYSVCVVFAVFYRKWNIIHVSVTPQAYKMSAPLRGRCLIINNQNFQRPTTGDQIDLSYREGSDVDVTNVRNVFHQLNFKCDVHTDLTCKVS